MKSIEQLHKLSGNPFYKMSEEESKRLQDYMNGSWEEDNTPEPVVKESSKKKSQLGNAIVKETGKLDKHHGDPVAE